MLSVYFFRCFFCTIYAILNDNIDSLQSILPQTEQKGNPMAKQDKYEKILDALQTLLEDRNLQTISVSEIAQTAGIGKGSIYYYFPSKEAILETLIERNYEKPLETAK